LRLFAAIKPHASGSRAIISILISPCGPNQPSSKMKPYSSIDDRAASLAGEKRLLCFVSIALALCFAGCASNSLATKSPADGSDYPGWTKAVSFPFTLMSHETTY